MTWQQIRQQVLERDEYRCRHCGSDNRPETHHIIPRRKGRLDTLENILTVCRKCHKTIEPAKIHKHEIVRDTVNEFREMRQRQPFEPENIKPEILERER